MGFYTTEPECERRGNAYPPSENRVRGFSATFRNRTRRSASQPLDPHRENRPTPTILASGVLFYGLRYYNPDWGRWMGRDPLGEVAGPNLYAFVQNDPVGNFDPYGLWIHIGLPKTTQKCNFVGALMAAASQPGTLNYMLWMRWLTGGGNVSIGYGWFDPFNACRNLARDEIRKNKPGAKAAAAGQSCNGWSLWKKDKFKAKCWSPHLMLNWWTQTTTYTIHVHKKCENGCCKKLIAEARWTNKAYDRTNFNPGDAFYIPPYEIEDELINQCFAGTDFDVNSTHHDDETWKWKCP